MEFEFGHASNLAATVEIAQSSAAFPTADLVKALFVEHNWADFLLLHDETSALWVPGRKFARQFLLEHDAFSWVKRQNFSQGVAPSAADVFHYYESKALEVEPCGEPRRRTVNKWAARWRARWGVRRASLRSADTVDPSILRDKAGIGQKNGSVFRTTSWLQIEGMSIWGAAFWDTKGSVSWAPKALHLSLFFATCLPLFETRNLSFAR